MIFNKFFMVNEQLTMLAKRAVSHHSILKLPPLSWSLGFRSKETFMRTVQGVFRVFIAAFALVIASGAFAADDGVWVVRKFSGEVWTTTGAVQQASLNAEDVLIPGNTIRTGRNGRVLLVRGEESILIAPNSVVGLPSEKKEGLATTIKQQAGSILLEVEKKNVKHFEVETPYLAAVVKGTQFRVTVAESGAKVDVVRGQVEVADFKTGQIAQVMAGQHATALSSGNAGLSLGGSGMLQPIQQGQPRASSVDRVPVPRNGLTAPGKAGPASLQQRQASTGARHGVVRISSSLGEVRLNVNRVTHGLARNAGTVAGARSAAHRENSTVWASADSGSSNAGSVNGGGGNGNSASGNGSNGGSAGAGSSGGSAAAGAVGGVGGAVGGVVGVVGGVVGGVGGTVGGVVGGVGGVVGGVGGTVGGVIGGVGGVVGGLTGGNGNNGNHFGLFKR
jgi:FecR protein